MRHWLRTSLTIRARAAVIALVVLAALAFAPAAQAGVITQWTVQPTGTVGTGVPVIVRGTTPVSPDALLASSVSLRVDGMVVPRSAYTATIARTSVYLYWAPSPVLPDGVRTFRAEVSDAAGRISLKQWTATIAQAPSLAWVAPLQGATLTNGSPAIRVQLADNTPTTTLTVAGEVHRGSATGPIVATFGGTGLSAGVASFSPSAELPVGTLYLTARVTDAAGNIRLMQGSSARMFKTEAPAPMSGLESCDACHPTIAAAHPTPATTDCTLCHAGYGDDHMQGTDYCDDCHWDGWHTNNAKTSVAVTSPCTSCHSGARAEVAQHTSLSVEPSHVGSCGGCHNESIVTRHATAPEGSAYSYQCDLCHASTDPAVVDAIAAGDTGCDACHAGGHVEQHETTVPASCAGNGCHSGTNLSPIHAENCAGCHDSTDPDVVLAIATANIECAACHSSQGVDYHTQMAAAHSSATTVSCFGVGCHDASRDLPTVHRIYAGPGTVNPEYADECRLCHSNPEVDVATSGTNCTPACHSGTTHSGYAAAHTITSASGGCTGCHASNLAGIHGFSGSNWERCDTCHLDPATGLANADCASCHHDSGVDYHAGFAPAHTYGALGTSCQAAGCHSASLVDAHAAFVGPTGRYPEYADTCELCHMNKDASRVPENATAACSSCHTASDHEALHSVTVEEDCAGCHQATSLTSLHTAVGCSACHESANATVVAAIDAGDKRCTTCHGTSPHPDQATVHQSAALSGSMNVFDYHEGYQPLSWDVPCTLCHATTNLVQVHASDCSACHSGTKPAESFATWNKTCQQAACHATIVHPSADPAHNSFDCEAACHESDWSVYYGSCEWCHGPGAAAPTTTSNTKASYVGSATITLSTANLSWTYYRLDGGQRTEGGTLLVPAPASGSANHTLEFWSVDDSGREELPHKSVSFSVSADTQPPNTTSNAATAYIGPATIKLTPTDNGDSPVQGTFWRLGTGSVTAGTTVSVPQPVSGQQGYVLEFWSVDASGNEELPHKTAAFTITADTTPPSGSLTLKSGAAYTTTQYVPLSMTATDIGGSGVSQMRFSNDNVTWSVWENFASTKNYYYLSTGFGFKTVWVQYRDVAGNVSTYSDTITFDGGGPAGSIAINNGAVSTTSPVVTINMSITDTPSGVASMRFSNENTTSWSAWEPFSATKTWTLAAGAGTRRVYAQFMDNAGNTSMTNDTITVIGDTIAPTGSIVINNGAATTDVLGVTLALSATDTGGSGLSQMQLSNDNVTWTSWEAYTATKSWSLTIGDGAKTVYVRYRDAQGNVSATYSDGITLSTADTTPPTGSISINGGAATTTTTAATLTLAATDTGGSGVTEMQFSSDNATWSAWETYATSKAWTLATGSGTRTVYVRYRDVAGNVSGSFSDTITLSAPTGMSTLAFVWHPDDWAEAHLVVTDAAGGIVIDTWVSGYDSDLDLYVPVPSDRDYYMECVYYYDEWWQSEGGPYGIWTNNTAINADGILSPGETVIWYY